MKQSIWNKEWCADNRRTLLTVGISAVVLVAAAFAVVLMRSGATGADPHADGTDPIGGSAGTAAASTVAAVNSFVPGEDSSPADAATRVIDRLSGKYLKLARDPEGAPRPDQWDAWARSGDRVHAVAEPTREFREPAEEATSATVPLKLRVFVWHADGERTPLSASEVRASMVREAGMWKLSDVEYVRSLP
ncbi:hypothetical protein HMPREF2857_10765 [Corynebacterium sp. HMSC076C10]|uniref:hypothetical protein n=1 Tax=Corynebacterium sp. HMSC076C10 TaxID=1739361 RepID=UPI0008A2A0F4|nr:hypothetical protein [Corynebacterium sp. HMSC076C10]OFJ57338.1 hypothetical protein HMPREF2857_10765 [Corynebacterium sp. HMSC076C10]